MKSQFIHLVLRKYHNIIKKIIRKSNWEIFNEYIAYGGLPILLTLDEDNKLMYLEDLYNAILLKDVVTKYNVKNPKVLNNLMHI